MLRAAPAAAAFVRPLRPRSGACHRPACRPAARLAPAAPARLRRCAGDAARGCGRRRVVSRAAEGAEAEAAPSSAAATAVAAGLAAFKARKYADAVQRFTDALAASPSEDEARAALYNRACAQVALSRFDAAGEDVRLAVNEYRLKYAVVAKDPDLAPLRASPGWGDLVASLQGAPVAVASATAAVRMRTEAKAPFRTFYLFILAGLGAGAALATFVTLPSLIKALSGLPGAPELLPTAGNLAVDLGVLVGMAVLAAREFKARDAAEAVVAREEALSKLAVATGGRGAARATTLGALRGMYRPVVLVASPGVLRGAVRGAGDLKRELQQRGVLLVPLDESEVAPLELPVLRRSTGKTVVQEDAAPDAEPRWRLPPLGEAAWCEWAAAQRAAATPPLDKGAAFHVVVALDGTVYRSGPGMPKWSDLATEFQPVESTVSKIIGV